MGVIGLVEGAGPKPKMFNDMFRVAGGFVAEHWDVLQGEIAETDIACDVYY